MEVGDRRLAISNLEKVLYPQTGFTKGQVLDYYARIAPVLLPHLAGRPLTRKRYPNGVEGPSFFEKNAPRGTPEWVRTVNLPVPGSTMNRETIDFVIVDNLETLVWTANLAALELHVPQWKVGSRGGVQDPDLLVLDLDPGAPATIVECCEVALLLKEILEADGLVGYAKTSGSKGLQMYAPIKPTPDDDTRAYARGLAKRLEKQRPDLVVSDMTKALRHGKVLVDWSQNAAAKTTVAPYSLRARPEPTVSTPVSWAEVSACRSPETLIFLASEVLERVERDGDLLADLGSLPTARRPRLP
ncbi:MAG TPA: non-homologous end-joining DNA ligase [Acidothermaceae bacterium]|nr:non-homologous end-joining DNA ligase [Acidothermaceae bacterium]